MSLCASRVKNVFTYSGDGEDNFLQNKNYSPEPYNIGNAQLLYNEQPTIHTRNKVQRIKKKTTTYSENQRQTLNHNGLCV